MARKKVVTSRVEIRFLAIFFFLLAALPGKAGAMPVGSSDVLSDLDQDIIKVQRVLESKIVSGKLTELGMNPAEIEKRLKALTDEEVHQFAANIDSFYAGGDAGGVMVVIAVVMMGIMLYYILTGGHMMGHGH